MWAVTFQGFSGTVHPRRKRVNRCYRMFSCVSASLEKPLMKSRLRMAVHFTLHGSTCWITIWNWANSTTSFRCRCDTTWSPRVSPETSNINWHRHSLCSRSGLRVTCTDLMPWLTTKSQSTVNWKGPGTRGTHSPGQTCARENITFPKLRWRAVTMAIDYQ